MRWYFCHLAFRYFLWSRERERDVPFVLINKTTPLIFFFFFHFFFFFFFITFYITSIIFFYYSNKKPTSKQNFFKSHQSHFIIIKKKCLPNLALPLVSLAQPISIISNRLCISHFLLEYLKKIIKKLFHPIFY
jgi:hypothetical protein